MQKKPIAINSQRSVFRDPGSRTKTPGNSANKANQWTRRSFVAMFCLGAHPRTIAKAYRADGVREADVLAEIRERVVCAGGLDEPFRLGNVALRVNVRNDAQREAA